MPGVRDGEFDPIPAVRDLAHAQRDLAFLRELAGMAQEIQQNLLEPHGISGDGAQVLLAIDNEPVVVLLCELSVEAGARGFALGVIVLAVMSCSACRSQSRIPLGLSERCV